ncbi:HNH endonuclease signature motif containing protein [Pseudoalteromonas sp. Z9A6]|uniref:HNH endonuclease n=1 Tax=Pseudoalteromonas sp. Z9A6 TaxID=2686352 RepID=UPI0013FE0FE8|nr:HNH endonuclease signature motif containing protein [Pseudoalteromonas sp. Z9A6]
MSDSRYIPADIKRRVRKECGFGCAICGMPFFDYDHIEEYSTVKEHTAENLILLCPNHHRAKPFKLSKDRIIEARAKPYNLNKNLTSPFKLEPSRKLKTLFGSNMVEGFYPDGNNEHYALWINGESFFTIHSENSWLCVSFKLTDIKGNILLLVENGEVKVSTQSWDYEWVGSNIKIRAGKGLILLDLNLSDNQVEILRGCFLDSGYDGFIINDGALLTIIEGQQRGVSIGSRAIANGFGGWGLLNNSKHPDIIKPNGFGFFRGHGVR